MKTHLICPVINCLDLTRQMVASINYSPIRVLILDNHSGDGTREWCEKNKIDVITNLPRKSVAASWNQGIREAMNDPECENVIIVNNDIYFAPYTIKRMIELKAKSEFVMVTGNNISSLESFENFKNRTQDYPIEEQFDLTVQNDWRGEGPDFSCFMIGRDFVEKVGWFDENYLGAYCEDWDAHARMFLGGFHCKRLVSAPYYHFASQTLARNAGISGQIGADHSKNVGYFFRKWGGEHPSVLDKKCFLKPFNDNSKSIKDW